MLRKKPQQQPVEVQVSVIRQGLEMIGDVSFTGELHIHGRVNGNIVAAMDSDSKLVLQPGSEINGEIRVPYVLAASKVIGDVFAFRRLTLTRDSVIQGNVHYSEVEMEQGASVNGMLVAMGHLED